MTTSTEAPADEITRLKARVKELEDGLAMLAEGNVPEVGGYPRATWKLMALYARRLLEGGAGS